MNWQEERDTSRLYSGNKQTIGGLFNRTHHLIVVPEWQRGFSWGDIEIECLWLDLLAFANRHDGASLDSHEYSLGSVVLARHANSDILLDGQHRLAFATILLAAVRDLLYRYSADAAADIQRKYVCGSESGAGLSGYKLTLNRVDRDFFRREIQDWPKVESHQHELRTESHRLIRRARTLLSDRLDTQCGYRGNGRQAFAWVLGLSKVLVDHVSVEALTSAWTSTIRLPRAGTASAPQPQ